jgi:hypothetical protein
MLGGQVKPGTVLAVATHATDPVAAAVFAKQAPRHAGVPGNAGNGKGMGGQIGFGGE